MSETSIDANWASPSDKRNAGSGAPIIFSEPPTPPTQTTIEKLSSKKVDILGRMIIAIQPIVTPFEDG